MLDPQDSRDTTTVSENANGTGAVGTLLKPARLDEELPVVSTNGNGFPAAEKLPEHHRRFYIPLKLKLLLVAFFSLAWVGFSLWLAIPWIEELGKSITVPLAAALIAGIAIIPGYLNAHLISSLLIDKAPPLRFDVDFPAITLIVACFNEEEVIEETLDYATSQDYPGEFRILVADDGSSDRTVEWPPSTPSATSASRSAASPTAGKPTP